VKVPLLLKGGEDLGKRLARLGVLLKVLLQLWATHRTWEALQADGTLHHILALLMLLEVLAVVLHASLGLILHVARTLLLRSASISRRHYVCVGVGERRGAYLVAESYLIMSVLA